MAKFDKTTTLKVKWSKREQDLMFYYPTHQGKFFGYEIAKLIKKEIKEYATDFDITTFNCTIKLTKEKIEQLTHQHEDKGE